MAASPKPVVFDTSVVSIIYNQDQRASFYEEGLEGHRAVVSFQNTGRDILLAAQERMG